jgi:multimeric flavodoxin WrbA
VWHSRTGLARQMAEALEKGAWSASHEMGISEDAFSVDMRRAADATVDDVLSSDGYLFCAPENLASASGEMLEFFHRSYYPMFNSSDETSRLIGRPCASS